MTSEVMTFARLGRSDTPRQDTTIYLVAHGLTPGDGTHHEIINGWEDQGLSPVGRRLLRQTAGYLSDKGIGETYSSDLSRAVESAEVIRAELGIEHPNTARHGLRSMDVGMLAGQNKEAVQPIMQRLLEKPWKEAPNGESYNKFLGRFQQELDRTIHEALGEEYGCVYVTHSLNLGALPHILSGGITPPSLQSPVGHAGVVELQVHDGGGWVVMRPTFDPSSL